MKKPIVIIFLFTLITGLSGCEPKNPIKKEILDLTQFVDPMIGTGFHGHTFPGPTLPHGQIQLSPDTHIMGWDASSGYHYDDETLYGFSHNHLSGTGIGDLGDFLFLPFTGAVENKPVGKLIHQNETAEVGYYSIQLKPRDILCELTTTERVGWHRYSYPESGKLPSIADLGLESVEREERTAFPFSGGTATGMERLEQYFWKSKKLSYYKNTRNGLLGTDYSSKFSPWLSNGCLSPKMIYWEIKRYEKEIQKNQSTYWLIFELIWRDYFKFISLKHGNKVFKIGGIKERDYHWKTDGKLFSEWAEGRTSEPFVNANMIELNQTGWMSNRGRQNVASFLAKDMKMDWRIGAAYFESLLVDYDVHSNYGNWMYVSGVGNDPRDRKFEIQWQAECYDPLGKFQKLWLQKTLF